MSNLKAMLLKNAQVVIVNGLGAVLLFVSTGMLTRSLGSAEYGRLAFAMTVGYLIATLGTVGLPMGAHKMIGGYAARGQWQRVVQFTVAGLIVSVLLPLLLAVVVHAVLPLVMRDAEALAFPWWAFVAIAVSLGPVRFLTDLTRALGRPVISSVVETILARLVIFAGVGWYWWQNVAFDAVDGAWLYVAGNVLAVVVFMAAASYAIRHQWHLYTAPRRRLGQVWVSQSLTMMVTPVFFFLMSQIDVLLLGILSTAEATGQYQVASRIANFAIFFWSAITPVMLSRFAAAMKNGDTARAQQAVDATNLMGALPTVLVVCGLFLFGRPLLAVFGDEFTAAYTVLLILSAGKLVDVLFGPNTEFLMMTGHHRLVSRINILAGIGNVLMCAPMILAFGANGAALSTALTLLGWKMTLAVVAMRHSPVQLSLPGRAMTIIRQKLFHKNVMKNTV